ncbi:MAG: hypothetical protein A2270_03415 [Elusimicrobia bacterium RIFOXYA12_FULL_51_18]|nr:MAG: hypothetical protein A2270_03415 [Elusimicrobia bacterium RIFOXYA12_FULL_51_18]OGS31895.1 MAG: hypothetical protein A2218_06380 [Elusimicrobia bacterium RIFOXYA2_FULL_53_38]
MSNIKFRELSEQGIAVARKLVSDKPVYGSQISLPAGFTFEDLLIEKSKSLGNRQIEFFEMLCNKRITGFCYYVIRERSRAAEIATIFLPEYRGMGLGRKTIVFMRKHATRYYPKLLRMEATASSSNPAAISTLLSGGFKLEGVLVAGYVRGGQISDALLFGILLGEGEKHVSSMYRFDSFKDKKKEKSRLIAQGKIIINHEAKLIRDMGNYARFANAGQIIDVGCGFGQFAAWLAAEFPAVKSIVGVDSSKDMIRESAAAGLERVKLVCLDGLRFLEMLPAGKTDIVCLRFVINHIPVRLWVRWLIAARRCLKSGGLVHLTLADANYYKTYPSLPMFDLIFKHKELLREKNGGIWNAPSIIGRELHAAGYRHINQQSVCLTTEDMGVRDYAASVGDQFVWGIESAWGKTGELARRSLIEASGRDDFWGEVKIGIHAGEKQKRDSL